MHVVIILLILFILLYCFAIFPEMSRQKRMKAFHGIMFAHRGLHSKTHGIPENSMSAFRAAIQKNYGIELDLHLTRDGELVVFHDDDLKRVCGRPERPNDLTAAELTKCTLLGTKEHIPLFRDVLALVNDQVPLLVELKIPERNMQICQKAYEMLRSYHGAFLLESFNSEGLYWFRKNAPEVLRGQLSSRLTKEKSDVSWFLRFFVENLWCNFLGRPDFIAYKLTDLPKLTVTLLRIFSGTTIAVWTLRTKDAIHEGKQEYDIQIFENPVKIINK